MLCEDVHLKIKSEKQNRLPQKTNKMQIKPKGNRNYNDGIY